MPRKLAFRQTLTDTKRANDAAHKMYAAISGRETPENVMNNVKPKVSRGPRKAKDTKSEAEVQAEVIHWLCRHPRVELVIRINSGAAGYVEFNHLYLPVKYRKTWPKDEKMLIPDVLALLDDARLMAVECKEEVWKRSFGDSVKAAREYGQALFLDHVNACNGIGIFAVSVDDVVAAL